MRGHRATAHAWAPISHTCFCCFGRTKLYSLAHPFRISRNSLRNLTKSASSPLNPRCDWPADELAASCSRRLARSRRDEWHTCMYRTAASHLFMHKQRCTILPNSKGMFTLYVGSWIRRGMKVRCVTWKLASWIFNMTQQSLFFIESCPFSFITRTFMT